jgi:hypothetical protein
VGHFSPTLAYFSLILVHFSPIWVFFIIISEFIASLEIVIKCQCRKGLDIGRFAPHILELGRLNRENGGFEVILV